MEATLAATQREKIVVNQGTKEERVWPVNVMRSLEVHIARNVHAAETAQA